MTHPTAEAVNEAARGWYESTWGAAAAEGRVPSWDGLTQIEQHSYRESALSLLAPAYPQIVADVLTHYADRLLMADPTCDVDQYVDWMREQAAMVQP